jgi:hypothetical protein
MFRGAGDGRIPLKDLVRFKERQWFLEEVEVRARQANRMFVGPLGGLGGLGGLFPQAQTLWHTCPAAAAVAAAWPGTSMLLVLCYSAAAMATPSKRLYSRCMLSG